MSAHWQSPTGTDSLDEHRQAIMGLMGPEATTYLQQYSMTILFLIQDRRNAIQVKIGYAANLPVKVFTFYCYLVPISSRSPFSDYFF